jgi:hypothetical protein
MASQETALRKRQQIARANRMMFLWIAGASVLVGIGLVVSFMLWQRMTFNEKVLAEKNRTVSTLRSNNAAVEELEANVRLLMTNEDLAKVKAKSEDSNLQVVLDALPADANSLALGASIQNHLLGGIEGLTIESTAVDPVYGVESTADAAIDSEQSADANQINFRFTVSGNAEAMRQALARLERSIRAIHVQKVSTESNGGNLQMTVQGVAFYEPARTVELKEKAVKP